MKRYVTDTQCLLWHMARALNLPLLTVDHAIVRSGLVDVIE